MSKTVLIASSSPRKNGNSETLADAFAKGALAGTVFAGGVNGVGDIAGYPALEQARRMGMGV